MSYNGEKDIIDIDKIFKANKIMYKKLDELDLTLIEKTVVLDSLKGTINSIIGAGLSIQISHNILNGNKP